MNASTNPQGERLTWLQRLVRWAFPEHDVGLDTEDLEALHDLRIAIQRAYLKTPMRAQRCAAAIDHALVVLDATLKAH